MAGSAGSASLRYRSSRTALWFLQRSSNSPSILQLPFLNMGQTPSGCRPAIEAGVASEDCRRVRATGIVAGVTRVTSRLTLVSKPMRVRNDEEQLSMTKKTALGVVAI